MRSPLVVWYTLNIRNSLRALILITVFPVAVFGIGGAYHLVKKERATLERAIQGRSAALMTAIESELQASIAALEALARTPSLQLNELAVFRIEAERALAARRGVWENIVLTDAQSHEMLINLLLPAGAPLPKTQDTESIVEAIQFRRGAVGSVAIGGVLKRPIFAVRVPVFRGDKALYVLAAVVDVRTIAKIAERQDIPENWTIAVLDGNYRFVMRRPAPPQGLEHASDSLRAAVAGKQGSLERGRLLDGTEIYRWVQGSTMSRWSTTVAVPRSVVDEGMRGLWLLIAGFASAAILGLWIAWLLASRISQPIAALAAAAPAVSRGETSAIPAPSPIDEVRSLTEALNEAAIAIRERDEKQQRAEQALRAADRAKDEFLAMLGHELRNPLSSVSNAAQLLLIARRDPAVLDNVSAILARQVEQMTRLVDDLLDAGRVTGGKVRLERVPVDLGGLAAGLIETWKTAGRFREHALNKDIHEVWVSADRARVEQIVSNLLDNALKYTPAGGRIGVSVSQHGNRAVLEVADNGEGMSAELAERAFDLFVQGERGLARQSGGLGIGLTLVKRLVELHDGVIRCASDGPGHGARFTVTLPAIEKPAVGDREDAASSTAATRRILIIEDNRDARDSLALLLKSGGNEVHIAENGEQGLAMMAGQSFDVVIVDIGLPDIDGYEVARRIRASGVGPMRLIALTGYGLREDRSRALASGFDNHLTKPVDLANLTSLLNR